MTRRALGAAGSPLAITSAALPLAAAAAWATLMSMPLADLVGARSVRIWGAVLALSLAAAAVTAAARLRWPAALVLAGCAAFLVQPAAWTAWRFDAEGDVGEGEPGAAWRRKSGGAGVVAPDVELVEVPSAPEPIRLRVDGEEVSVAPGEWASAHGWRLAVREVGYAPSYVLRDAKKNVLDQALVKVARNDRGYMEIGVLPHRFYLSISPDAARDRAPPTRLHLRVQRGKLKVLERDVEMGETVAFEGLEFTWSEGARWARFEVRRSPFPGFLVAGAVLVCEGGIAAFLMRRRRTAA